MDSKPINGELDEAHLAAEWLAEELTTAGIATHELNKLNAKHHGYYSKALDVATRKSRALEFALNLIEDTYRL